LILKINFENSKQYAITDFVSLVGDGYEIGYSYSYGINP